MTPTGIKTAGIGVAITSHLNLTRTMADVMGSKLDADQARFDHASKLATEREKYRRSARAGMITASGRIAFAGYDGKERNL